MSDWVCYMITSLDSNCTYIGSSNNFIRRLNNHNCNVKGKKRLGAKRTRGQTWIPVIIISGFSHKIACLSFEAGWKRLAKKRNNQRLKLINIISQSELKYHKDPIWDRIMDLIYFTHNFTYLGKFKINYQIQNPIHTPGQLNVEVFMEDWIKDFPWPFFIIFN